MVKFGDFGPLCRNIPSYPWCNLFYRQLLDRNNPIVTKPPAADQISAPIGINPQCGIPRAGQQASLGNIANIVLCAISMIVTLLLIIIVGRRKAAVGRVELRGFLVVYLLTLPMQLISTGSLLEQGSTPLVVITAIHAGTVAAVFWSLLANALVATQIVEDGTFASILPFGFFSAAFFGATTYVSLDTALGITNAFKPTAGRETDLGAIVLFVLTNIWPAVAALLFLVIMTYIVLCVLNEFRPMWYYILAATLFVLSQLAMFLLGRIVCKGSGQKVDASFIATFLETAAVFVLYLAWKSITEESWDEDAYYPS